MLVVTLKPDEALLLGEDVRVVVVSIEGGKVRLGVDAPKALGVRRAGAGGQPSKPRRAT